KTCKDVILHKGEVVALNNWIMANDGSETPLVGRVLEIIQVPGTALAREGKASYILLERHAVHGHSQQYGMPRLRFAGWSLVLDALCAVNTQHNCAEHACDASGTLPVRQEGELTTHTRACIRHNEPEDRILNTAQMRSARYIQLFQNPINPIDRDNAIHIGAAAEIASRKASQQEAAPAQTQRGG
ncbi:hypothetical protein FA95DRAFT_1457217, partial [Auriscalpium vulgare]